MKVQFYAKLTTFRRRKQWRARIVSKGRITFASGESYNNLRDLEDAVLSLGLPPQTPIEYLGIAGELTSYGGFISSLHAARPPRRPPQRVEREL